MTAHAMSFLLDVSRDATKAGKRRGAANVPFPADTVLLGTAPLRCSAVDQLRNQC
jgi:hypothetical protein